MKMGKRWQCTRKGVRSVWELLTQEWECRPGFTTVAPATPPCHLKEQQKVNKTQEGSNGQLRIRWGGNSKTPTTVGMGPLQNRTLRVAVYE
jgi:hypothetical protein